MRVADWGDGSAHKMRSTSCYVITALHKSLKAQTLQLLVCIMFTLDVVRQVGREAHLAQQVIPLHDHAFNGGVAQRTQCIPQGTLDTCSQCMRASWYYVTLHTRGHDRSIFQHWDPITDQAAQASIYSISS